MFMIILMGLKINVTQIIKRYFLKYFFKILFLFKCSVFLSMVEAKIIYDFSRTENLDGWHVVDDGVMGGRSKGKLKIKNGDTGVFSGKISLDNYGGFSSIRYYLGKLNVKKNKYVTIILSGDNKYYQLRIRSSRNDRHVYTKKFFAKDGWQEIRIPLDSMEPYFRGQRLRMSNFDKKYISEIGFLIGNKVRENFELKIRSIILEEDYEL